MEENFVSLVVTSGSYHTTIVDGILRGAGIPFVIRESSPTQFYIGPETPLSYHEFLVPDERLKEAKEVLCASGVVCDVSEHLLQRAWEEIVRPILAGSGGDIGRLVRFLVVNNKETVRALAEATLRALGGRALLEDVFFRLDGEENMSSLRTLARVLGPKAESTFYARLREALASSPPRERLALMEVIRELPDTAERAQALAVALRDPSPEVREAAEEALFSLGKGDFGYSMSAPDEERERAVARFLDLYS